MGRASLYFTYRGQAFQGFCRSSNPRCYLLHDVCACVELARYVSFAGIEKECRVIREYHWRPPIKNMFDTEVRTLLCV